MKLLIYYKLNHTFNLILFFLLNDIEIYKI